MGETASALESPSPGYGTLLALVLVIGASGWLGMRAERAMRHGSFLRGYFLGNRGLGAWALALTATVQSGGTFMGFPSLIYSHGWIVALWIASYMVVPITGFGFLGKRLAQLSRKTGAITVPDLLRERFGASSVGLIGSLLIMFFMLFSMIAQFKAGALLVKLAWPDSGILALSDEAGPASLDRAYYIGLAIFSVTVVGYTLFGGFLASVWTDLFQSVLMLVGVVILLALVLPAAGGLEQATRTAVEHTDPNFAFGPGYSADGRQFLTGGLAFSFFFVWIFGGIGSPAGLVRIMACKDTPTIRRSMVLLSLYNLLIYLPLVAICVCGRALLPELPVGKSDEIIPRLAIGSTQGWPGGSLVSGLILSAPFGAVMATVSTYLVVIASGLVRDVYQQFMRPRANWVELRRVTYTVMVLLGAICVAAVISPPNYLQALVVFSSTGQAAAFVAPSLMTLYWRRATAAGVLAAMLVGAGVVLGLYIPGWTSDVDPMIGNATAFRPYFLLGLEPVVWGVLASVLAGVGVSLATKPPAPDRVAWLFDAS